MSIGIAILGFAHGHVGMYCNRWKSDHADEVRLLAGWDHDAQRAEKAREQWGVTLASSPADACAVAGVDAVVIGAETSSHAELVEVAAAHGKAIVLQKPLALTLDEGERIVRAVRMHKVPFTLCWQMRIDPQNLQMREMVQSGALGRIFMVRRRHGLNTHTWPGFENSWHAKKELNRGMWADDASHAIDFLLWLLGRPQSVSAEIGTLHNPNVPDDNGIAIFKYADGALAEITCSFTCVAGENTTEIVGEKGVIIQNYGDLVSCNAPRPPGAIGLKWLMHGEKQWTISDIASPAAHGERIQSLAPEIVKFLNGERGPIATAEEGLTALAMTLACHTSSDIGGRIKLNDINIT